MRASEAIKSARCGLERDGDTGRWVVRVEIHFATSAKHEAAIRAVERLGATPQQGVLVSAMPILASMPLRLVLFVVVSDDVLGAAFLDGIVSAIAAMGEE